MAVFRFREQLQVESTCLFATLDNSLCRVKSRISFLCYCSAFSLTLPLSLSLSLFLNLSYFLSIRQVTLYSRRREGRGAGDKATSIPGRIKKQCSKVSLQATVMRSDEMNGTDCKVAITGFNCSTLCVALFSFSLSPCSSFPCH